MTVRRTSQCFNTAIFLKQLCWIRWLIGRGFRDNKRLRLRWKWKPLVNGVATMDPMAQNPWTLHFADAETEREYFALQWGARRRLLRVAVPAAAGPGKCASSRRRSQRVSFHYSNSLSG